MTFLVTPSEWFTLAGLVVAIVTPIVSAMIFFNERARKSREKLYDKLDELREEVTHLHDCIHRVELRMVKLEALGGRQEARDIQR